MTFFFAVKRLADLYIGSRAEVSNIICLDPTGLPLDFFLMKLILVTF
jgi:hypothetical protein